MCLAEDISMAGRVPHLVAPPHQKNKTKQKKNKNKKQNHKNTKTTKQLWSNLVLVIQPPPPPRMFLNTVCVCGLVYFFVWKV